MMRIEQEVVLECLEKDVEHTVVRVSRNAYREILLAFL